MTVFEILGFATLCAIAAVNAFFIVVRFLVAVSALTIQAVTA